MTEAKFQPFYISGPEKPFFSEKGLYSGYKSRKGIGAHLPVTLKKDEEYTNTGYLDALPHGFLHDIGLKKIRFNVKLTGKAIISFYVLLANKNIYHCQDYIVDKSTEFISLSKSITQAPNGRLIFFRIKALEDNVIINAWCFSSEDYPTHLLKAKEIKVISRTLGESEGLIEQFQDLYEQYQIARKNFPAIISLPFPRLIIFESDEKAYKESRLYMTKNKINYVTLRYNEANLGGGGNMCLAVYEEFYKKNNCNQFIMLDSDTYVPFRTLYFSSALALTQSANGENCAIVPTILYAERPNTILESGALFGRGNWGVASSKASQPCIAPLFHNRQVSEMDVQSSIAQSSYTDYPPFIFSVFTARTIEQKVDFLPIPFFLRGDDIELGMHLRSQKINCEVKGWLTVFQQPKHSLWHEWMAILHGSCLIIANMLEDNDQEFVSLSGLKEYFLSRKECHARAFDCDGLTVYQNVLKTLTNLITLSDSEIIGQFHDPEVYLNQRKLNSNFSASDFKVVEALEENGGINGSKIIKLPFLYFDVALDSQLQSSAGLPEQIILVNHSNKTANIIDIRSCDLSKIHEISADIDHKLDLLLANSTKIAKACKLICSRERILADYLPKYTKMQKTNNTKKGSSRQ